MPLHQRSRRLVFLGVILLISFIVGAGGAARRYNRILYGAPPLVLALICFGAAAYLHASHVRRRAWVVMSICCGLVAAGVVAVWLQPSLAGAVKPEPRIERAHVLLTLHRDRVRAALFAELQPMQLSNCTLERFGEKHDGGYLMCTDLLGSVKAGYSYGISGYDGWGCDITRRLKAPVHQYDCFDLTQPACPGGDTVFHPECIGPLARRDEQGRIFETLESQFKTNGDSANRVVVKMDVEGAEWETLLRAPLDVLSRIDQLAIELHGTGLDHHLAVVRRLKEVFHVAHVHFNNYACTERIDPFPAGVYEVLFVNKRIAASAGPRVVGPHPLDAPNTPQRPDCQAPTTRWTHLVPGSLRSVLLR